MIILRKIGQQSDACRVILADTLSGTADGVNQVFSVTHEYVAGKIEILYNGQVLISGVDFEETGPKEITFIYLKPEEMTVLRANYETGDCNDPSSPSSTNFLGLTDTPTTYSGFENYYLKVNSGGTGVDFYLPDRDVQEGTDSVPDGVSSTAVSFPRDFVSDDYVLTVALENSIDSEPSVYPTLIKDKTKSGFTVDFSGDIDSGNYILNWRASVSGTSYPVGGSSAGGITELSEDTSPELSADLYLGNNLVMLDTTPSGSYIHGYTVGYSGDASEMYVQRNDTGVGCPLYMRSNGQWFQCTAVSGTAQMPCAALALEEGDGSVKKILWKGIVRRDSWSWTPGDMIYVSTVEGALTNVISNSGAWVQPIGVAIASNVIRFDPGFNPGYIN